MKKLLTVLALVAVSGVAVAGHCKSGCAPRACAPKACAPKCETCTVRQVPVQYYQDVTECVSTKVSTPYCDTCDCSSQHRGEEILGVSGTTVMKHKEAAVEEEAPAKVKRSSRRNK